MIHPIPRRDFLEENKVSEIKTKGFVKNLSCPFALIFQFHIFVPTFIY